MTTPQQPKPAAQDKANKYKAREMKGRAMYEEKVMVVEGDIFSAVHDGDIKKVKYFIKKKVNLNQRSVEGWTPLHNACKQGFVEAVQALIEAGADIEATSQNKITPFLMAAFHNHLPVLEVLMRNKANIYAKSNNMYAADLTTKDEVRNWLLSLDHEKTSLEIEIEAERKRQKSLLKEAKRQRQLKVLGPQSTPNATTTTTTATATPAPIAQTVSTPTATTTTTTVQDLPGLTPLPLTVAINPGCPRCPELLTTVQSLEVQDLILRENIKPSSGGSGVCNDCPLLREKIARRENQLRELLLRTKTAEEILARHNQL